MHNFFSSYQVQSKRLAQNLQGRGNDSKAVQTEDIEQGDKCVQTNQQQSGVSDQADTLEQSAVIDLIEKCDIVKCLILS